MGSRSSYLQTRYGLALLYSLLYQYRLREAQALGDHMAQRLLQEPGQKKEAAGMFASELRTLVLILNHQLLLSVLFMSFPVQKNSRKHDIFSLFTRDGYFQLNVFEADLIFSIS